MMQRPMRASMKRNQHQKKRRRKTLMIVSATEPTSPEEAFVAFPVQSTLGRADKVWKFFPCSGHDEGIVVTYWPEDKEYTFTIFRLGKLANLNFWEKIRVTWQLWRTGKVCWDDVLLSKHVAKKMAREIIRLSAKGAQ